MDTLKSYFTKMKILPGHGSKHWRFHRKGSVGKSGLKAKYSRSKSQNDAAFEAAMEIDDLQTNRPDGRMTTSFSGASHDVAKSPPTKPPRKDQICAFEFKKLKGREFGVLLDVSAGQSCEKMSGENGMYDSTDELMARSTAPVRITHIVSGSVADHDGRLKVHDEIIDIDSVSMAGHDVETVRQKLAEGIKRGRVAITIRRKRKRPAPLPPSPIGGQSSLRQPYSSSSSNIIESCQNGLHPSNQNGGKFTQSASCLDTDYHHGYMNGSGVNLNSLHSSNNSLNASNDDVFTETTEHDYPAKKLPYLNGFSNAIGSPRHRRKGLLEREHLENLDPDRPRTQSASAVEDVQWAVVPIENTDYVNTTELASHGNYGVLMPISDPNNCEADSNLYQSDTELQVSSRPYVRKVSRTQEVFRMNNNSTPTSLCSFDEGSEYDLNCQSSPGFGKKRIIARMHLLKEDNSLGLHIAGGRGSKRGDIGIFVAGITEGGPAHRDGRLKRGDELLMINGRSLIGLTHFEAVEVLRSSPKLVQLVVAAKVRKSMSIASTASSSTTVTSPTSNPSEGVFMNTPIPEVMAQTPQGSMVNWEDLFDKFNKATDEKPPTGSRSGPRRTRSPSPRHQPPQTVTVQKVVGGKGLGFTIVGGSDTSIGNLGIIVRRIFTRGLIAEDGRMKEGDEVLELNGESLRNLMHKEVISRFRSLKKGPVTITFRHRFRSPHCSPARSPHLTPSASCDGSPVSTPGHSPRGSLADLHELSDQLDTDVSFQGRQVTNGNHRPTFSVPVPIPRAQTPIGAPRLERLSPDHTPKTQHEVLLNKDNGVGLGISVIRKTCDGVSEIHIQDIGHGSPADRDGRLRKGDMIVEVNGRPMRDMTLLDAYQLFRTLPPGQVVIVIRRGDNSVTIQLMLDSHSEGSESRVAMVTTGEEEEEADMSREDTVGPLTQTGYRSKGASTDPEYRKEPVRKRLSTVSEEAGSPTAVSEEFGSLV